MSKPIGVVIADDHAMFASALAEWLKSAEGMRVLAVVHRADHAVTAAIEHNPDVILMDVDMPGLSCFDAARIIAKRRTRCAIIFVSAFTHDHYIEQALAVEAAGYVTKDEPPESVVAAIRTVASGGAYFSPEVQSRIIVDAQGVRLAGRQHTRLSLLTPRELAILGYLAHGLSKKEIARTLSVAVKTVDAHTVNLMNKLDIHDRVELALFAVGEGLANP